MPVMLQLLVPVLLPGKSLKSKNKSKKAKGSSEMM
jgi:hypothetical protein